MSGLPAAPHVSPVESEALRLRQAFTSFNEISLSLEKAYLGLQQKVEQLSEELEVSNYYLSSLLESLPCGVLVVNKAREVTLINRAAAFFFSAQALKLPVPLARLLQNVDFSDTAIRILNEARDATEIKVIGDCERILLCSWSRMRDGDRTLVVQDVTEMRRLEAEMRKAEKIAAMGEMALEVAHEIRNPLGVLELFAGLLQDRDLEWQEREQYLTQVQIGIRSLNSVLTNMLCFSKRPEPSLAAVQPDLLLNELLDFMAPLLEQREIEVVRRLNCRAALLGDREMLRQVFVNLITNSLQALPRGGRVEVESASSDGVVTLVIADNGIGIPEAAQARIFDPGFSSGSGGNGLGLAIVHRLLQSHGAEIRVESAPGQGTRFLLRFAAVEEEL